MKELEQLIYGLHTHQLPPDIDYKKAEELVWQYAKEVLGDVKVADIKNQEDPFLELYVALLAVQNKEGNIPQNLNELVKDYEKHLEQNPPKSVDKEFLALLKNRHPDLKLDNITDFDALVAIAIKLDPELYNLDLTLRDIPLSPKAKNEIIVFKSVHNANEEQVREFILNRKNELLSSTEAAKQKVVDERVWTETIAKRVGNFQIGATRDELVHQTLFAHAIAAGMTEKAAKEFAIQSTSTFKAAYVIASYEKTDGTKNPEQKRVKYKSAFLKLLPAVLDHKRQTIDGLQNDVVKILHTTLKQRIYEISEKAYGAPDRIYAPQEFPLSSPERSEFVEFVGSLGNKGLGYVQDFATKEIKTYAIRQLAATEFGQQIIAQVGAKFGTQVLTNLGIQTAAAIGTETAVVASGTAVAAATGPVGWIALATAAVVAIAPKFKDVVSWASKEIKKWTLAAAGAVGVVAGIWTQLVLGGLGLAGGLTGGISFLVGGAAGGITYFTLQTGSPVAGFQILGSYASAGFTGLAGLAVVEIATPIIIILLSTPIVIALLLFIINNSAYMVPPSGITVPRSVGFLPGCPAEMWPVAVNEGQKYAVTQGPGGPGSHGPPGAKVYEEAIDIFPIPRDPAIRDPDYPTYDPTVHLIVATHPGIVTASKKDKWGGNYIYLKDTCGGDFQTSYVHQLVNYVAVGQVVNTGDIIGVMGFTGHVSSRSPAGAHLHYAFLDTDDTWKSRSEAPPFMIAPFIPKSVPQFCSSLSQCNTFVP